jgi:hypothetical protein
VIVKPTDIVDPERGEMTFIHEHAGCFVRIESARRNQISIVSQFHGWCVCSLFLISRISFGEPIFLSLANSIHVEIPRPIAAKAVFLCLDRDVLLFLEPVLRGP